ncbi:MAG: hypothetical protein FJX67_09720 [Alphaproteobacteria bacterium]|nr:hypothetical protein [Alphaproteobacteria bacterium]
MPRPSSRREPGTADDNVVAFDRFGILSRAHAHARGAGDASVLAADALAPANERPVSAEIVTGIVRMLDPALAIIAAIAAF